jgi:enterochelin esterase family protein
MLDGRTYLDSMTMPVTLYNLIAKGRIPPLVAVMVHTRNRNLELHHYEPFVEFLDKELLPGLSAQYRITHNPEETIIGGASAGGLTAAFAAFRRPERFGNVLSQSGAFWWDRTGDDSGSEWLLRQYAARPKMKVRFYMEAGVMETSAAPDHPRLSILESNWHMRDVLKGKGYEVHYQEVGGAHQPVSWRGGLADGLIALAGSFARG